MDQQAQKRVTVSALITDPHHHEEVGLLPHNGSSVQSGIRVLYWGISWCSNHRPHKCRGTAAQTPPRWGSRSPDQASHLDQQKRQLKEVTECVVDQERIHISRPLKICLGLLWNRPGTFAWEGVSVYSECSVRSAEISVTQGLDCGRSCGTVLKSPLQLAAVSAGSPLA